MADLSQGEKKLTDCIFRPRIIRMQAFEAIQLGFQLPPAILFLLDCQIVHNCILGYRLAVSNSPCCIALPPILSPAIMPLPSTLSISASRRLSPHMLTLALKAHAHALGFDLVAVAPAGPSPDHDRYRRWLEAGYAGEMGYLARHAELKADPRTLLPEAQSIILVGLSYAIRPSPALRADPSRGQIATYALGRDYHDVIRGMLKELDGWLRAQTGRSRRGRVFVDSAPVLERSWASHAGMGFIGKNTCLIHPSLGSDLFLGGLLVPETLDYDEPPGALEPKVLSSPPSVIHRPQVQPTCGRCTRCLDVCPTGALVSAHQLDARRCISYLTIELRGDIPLDLRTKMGNWVFGCDLCQDICPWNRAAARRSPVGQRSRLLLDSSPLLLDLLVLNQSSFAARFGGSPVMRATCDGFLRNVCVAAGNWRDPAALPGLEHHLNTGSPLVASHAAWALGRLADGAGRAALTAAWDRTTHPTSKNAIALALT